MHRQRNEVTLEQRLHRVVQLHHMFLQHQLPTALLRQQIAPRAQLCDPLVTETLLQG
ncbi:hypothetical protein D3C71_1924920 [compost metagenome]